MPRDPAQPGRGGDRHPVARLREDPFRRRPPGSGPRPPGRRGCPRSGRPRSRCPGRRTARCPRACWSPRPRPRRRPTRPRMPSAPGRRPRSAASSLDVEVLPAGHPGRLAVGPLPQRRPPTCSPFSVNSSARQLPVPASIASRYAGPPVTCASAPARTGHRSLRRASTSAFTRWAGASPATRLGHGRGGHLRAPRRSVSRVAPPMCGVTMTFGRSSSGCRSPAGRVPPRRSAAPARRPLASARARASSSTSDSRAVLMKNAPGRIRANAAAPNMCRLSAVVAARAARPGPSGPAGRRDRPWSRRAGRRAGPGRARAP